MLQNNYNKLEIANLLSLSFLFSELNTFELEKVAGFAKIQQVAAKKTSKTSSAKISAAERYRMVETAAYFIAERHDFTGNSTDYWITAEAQIKKMLAK